MDFDNILQMLSGLLGNKQAQQTSQYGQNLGLQNQELAQQNNQFTATNMLQNRALDTSAAEHARQLALEELEAQRQNALNQGQFGLSKQGQEFNQAEQRRLNVTPGSATWYQMQDYLRPKTATSSYSGVPSAPLKAMPQVIFVPNTTQRLY